eukprot:13523-Heterococcus_DN1.PRE.2
MLALTSERTASQAARGAVSQAAKAQCKSFKHDVAAHAIINGGFAADWSSGIRAAAVHSNLPVLKALLAAAPSDQLSRLAQCALASSCDTAVKDAQQRSATQSFVDYALAQFFEAGGNLQADITAGRTLLHESVLKGSGVVRRALLAATTETASTQQQQQQQCCLLAQQDSSDCTALHAAVEASTASWHNTKALRDLLSRSSAAALIEALPKQDKDGRSVLHYAVSKSSDADGSLQKLLSKCKELGVLSSVLRIRDYSGADAVCCARRYGRAAVLSLLQQHGIHELQEPLQGAELDCSTAHDAVKRGHMGCLTQLLASDPSLALAEDDEQQKTPLHCIKHDAGHRCYAFTAALLAASAAAAVAAVAEPLDDQL